MNISDRVETMKWVIEQAKKDYPTTPSHYKADLLKVIIEAEAAIYKLYSVPSDQSVLKGDEWKPPSEIQNTV